MPDCSGFILEPGKIFLFQLSWPCEVETSFRDGNTQKSPVAITIDKIVALAFQMPKCVQWIDKNVVRKDIVLNQVWDMTSYYSQMLFLNDPLPASSWKTRIRKPCRKMSFK